MIVKFKNSVIDRSKKYKSNFKRIKKHVVAFFKEKGKMKKLKKLLKMCWQFIIRREVLVAIIMALPFAFMDFFTRIHGSAVGFYSLFPH